jgi:beta-galactosidase
MKSCLFPVFLLMVGLNSYAQNDQIISLNGNWNYQFDKDNLGISEEWYKKAVSPEGQVLLPGTTDTRGIGPVNTESSEFHLNRAYKYRGAVWFETMVTIPASWKNRAVSLDLERVQWESRVWIDGVSAGMQESLSVPHNHTC